MTLHKFNYNILLFNKSLIALLLSFIACSAPAHASKVVTPLGDMSVVYSLNTGGELLDMTVDQIVFDDWISRAENGDAEYQYNIGLYYQRAHLLDSSIGFAKRMALATRESITWLEKAASQGLVKSHSYLGKAYSELNDDEKSFKHHKIAAEYGIEYSERMVAGSYKQGRGVEADIQKAIFWYKKSAMHQSQGSMDSEFALGKIYRDSGDVTEAMKWFVKVANNKSGDHAYLEIGKLYYDTGDYNKAIYWLNRASTEASSLPADSILGQMYFNGLGVEQDKQRACIRLEVAASAPTLYYRGGDLNLISEARYKLGKMYYEGEGCIQNPNLGYAWLSLSKSAGKEINLEQFRRDVNISNALSLVQKCSDISAYCKLN